MVAPTLGSPGSLDACLRSSPLNKSAGRVIISQFSEQVRRTWYPRWSSTRSLLGRSPWATKMNTSRSSCLKDRVEPYVTLYMKLLIRGMRTRFLFFLPTRSQEPSHKEKAKCNMITLWDRCVQELISSASHADSMTSLSFRTVLKIWLLGSCSYARILLWWRALMILTTSW